MELFYFTKLYVTERKFKQYILIKLHEKNQCISRENKYSLSKIMLN